MNILVTGGAGYIGSNTCVELLEAGHEVVIFLRDGVWKSGVRTDYGGVPAVGYQSLWDE